MKLIASDLDGTLLNEKGEISKENTQAIQKALDLGIQFVVATGRPYSSAIKPLQAAGLSCPIICHNGATTYDSRGNLLQSVPLEITAVNHIISNCQNIYIEFLTNRGGFAVSDDTTIDMYIEILKTTFPQYSEDEIRRVAEQRFIDEQIKLIQSHDEIIADGQIEIYKILCFSRNQKILSDIHQRLNTHQKIVITSSDRTNLEFNDPDAQKGIALEALTSTMNIQMKDVMAIGDNLNDKTMLERVGRGVAMANALKEIKQVCAYSTTTNNQNGVALAIEEMLNDTR